MLQAIAAVALVAGASAGAQVPGKVYPIQAWCSPGWPRPFETPQQTCDWVGRGWPHPLYWYPSAAAPPHFPYGYCCDPLQPPVNPYCQYIQKPKHCPSGYFAESFVRGRGCGIAGYSDGFEGDDTMYCQRDGYDPYKNKGACNNGTPVPGVGNPINTGIYNKFQVEADLVFGSGGRERSIQRTYNSAKVPEFDVVAGVPTPRMFGPHWSSTFDRRLMGFTYGANSTTWAVRPDGKAYFFNRVGTQWIPDPDVVDTLVQTLDASGNQTGWRYVEAATQDAEIYDVDGKLIEVQARDGYPLTLSYTGGNLTSVQDPFGKTITFTYGPYGFVSSLTAPTIGTVLYRYDTDYNLTEVEHPGSVIRRYHYENTTFKGALTGITDELGVRYATFGYDGYGSATLTYLAGNVNRWSIAQVSGKLRVTDPRGYTIDQTYVNSQGVAKLTSSTQPCAACGGAGAASAYSYDTDGNLASKADFNGKKTCYAYDTTRNLETARLEGATSAEDCTTVLETPPDRPDVRKVTTTWHATWRQPASIVEPAPGGTKTTAFTYDASGNLTQRKITAPKNDGTATSITRTWKWTWGSYGRVLTASDPNNKVTTTGYHPDDDPDTGRRGQVATVTNPLGHVAQYPTYDLAGRLTSTIDPNGVLTTLAYDARGRLVSRVVGGEETTYTYDLAGQLTEVELPDGALVEYVYDPAHRLTEIRDGLGNRIVYTLDAMGNRTQEEAFDPSGTLARTRSRVYDSLNRLAQEVGAVAQTTTHGYDGNGNRLTTTDPLDRGTANAYDALNRLLTVTDPAAGVTRYAYDTSGNLVSVTDPRDLVTTYGYDGLGNAVTQVSPDTGTTTRTFDAAGNVKTSTDARSAKATTTYDAAGRVTRIVHSRTGFTSETHTFQWDGGTTGAPNAKGRLTQVVDPSGTTKWSYSPQGRVSSRQQVSGSVTLTTSYAWANGRLTGMTTPSGQQLGYAYADGKVSAVTLNGSPLVSSIGHEPFGGVSVWQWGNGHKTWRDQDLDGRIASWEYRNGASILRRDLSYDAASRVTGVSDPASPSNTHTYGYDVLDRLTTALSAAATPTTRQYGYDAIGNRLNETADGSLTNYGYGPESHRLQTLTGATTRSYGYDGAGNPVAIDARTHTYNLANRLTKVAQGSTTIASYKLNARGQRVAKTVGATTTRYVYDEQGRLIGEYQANGTLIQETVWLGDLPIATLRPTGTGNPTPVAVYYVHADHLGSPRAITRPSDDAILWRWDNADPFGDNAADENPSGQGSFRYDLRFPGQQYDAETGTHYNYFRDYDPQIGRFSQSDPIGLGGGLNTYAYVEDAPLMRNDPYGLAGQVRPCPPGWICLPPIVGPGPILPPELDDILNPPRPGWGQQILNKLKELCTPDDDPCLKQWVRESADCLKWSFGGGRWVRACQGRANDRLRLCRGNGGTMPPDAPEPWRPDSDQRRPR